jgi:4-oxalocrotonate tautomerase
MPVIRVELLAGRTREQKRAFTKALTDAFVATCGGVPQSVQVIFYDVEKDDWGIAGRLTSDPAPPKPVECAYAIEGKGPPVFLVHGIGARRQGWAGLVEPGQGGSARAPISEGAQLICMGRPGLPAAHLSW